MTQSEIATQKFIQELLSLVAEFQPIYKEHMNDNGDLLPHVLMGGFVRFLFDAYRKSMTSKPDAGHWHQVVNTSLVLVEHAMNSDDPQLANLISVSFVENLLPSEQSDTEIYVAIKAQLGPRLKEELKLYD